MTNNEESIPIYDGDVDFRLMLWDEADEPTNVSEPESDDPEVAAIEVKPGVEVADLGPPPIGTNGMIESA